MDPIAVGGVGGSGTRIVANFIRSLGVHIGSDLNPALDNKWFTLMFKRRSWADSFPGENEIVSAAEVFTSAMTGGRLGRSGMRILNQASLECLARGHNVKGSGRGLWALRTRKTLLRAAGSGVAHVPWGWKEPNTHLFVPTLSTVIPKLRYVHVIRDGLVMASSSNWDQTAMWGGRFGVEGRFSRSNPPSFSNRLEYWIRANQAAISKAESHLKGRFRLLRFEEVTESPRLALGSLASWLRYELTEEADAVIRTVRSSARPRTTQAKATAISRSDLRVMRNLGYELGASED